MDSNRIRNLATGVRDALRAVSLDERDRRYRPGRERGVEFRDLVALLHGSATVHLRALDERIRFRHYGAAVHLVLLAHGFPVPFA